MTRPLLVLALMALVAGCAGANDNSPEGQCRRQAYDDPEVKDAIELANTSLSEVRMPALMKQKQLVAEATQRCLAAQGLAPAGGVEPVQRY